MIPCIGPLYSHVRCEILPRGFIDCLGPSKLQCITLPTTTRAQGKSLPRSCRLGFETFPRTLRALGCESLSKNMRAWGGSLPMTSRLGCESLPRTCGVRCETLPRTSWTRV